MKESELKDLDLKNPKSVKTLADYARDETARKLILSSNILSSADWSTNPCSDSLVELCRLFGNLCFNSPAGRQLVDETNLLSTIFYAVEQQNLNMTESRLYAVVPGLLQNYCIDNPLKNISSIQPLLDQLATQLLLVQDFEMIKPFQDFLFAVLEEDGGLELLTDKVLNLAARALRDPGVDPDFLVLFTTQAEQESVSKPLLLFDLHLALIDNVNRNTYKDDEQEEKEEEEEKHSRELVLELLVVLLSHASLEQIDPALFLPWLESNDLLLVSMGYLILGNFATSDTNINTLISGHVIDLFFNNLNLENERVQHSLLGCIRNCCINVKTREILLGRHLVSKMLEMAGKSISTGILLKIVAILRLMSQNNEDVSTKIGTDSGFVGKVVSIGRNGTEFSSTLGQLNVEAARLFSSLITSSKSEVVASTLVEAGVLPFILSLLSSGHPIMLNQAILPLCILSMYSPLQPNLVLSLPPEIFDKISNLIENPIVPNEIKFNALNLLETLGNHENEQVLKNMRESDLKRCIAVFKEELVKIRETVSREMAQIEYLLSLL